MLWLLQKAFNEAQKRKLPLKAETHTGSLETVFAFLVTLSKDPAIASVLGGAVGAVMAYALKRPEKYHVKSINHEARRLYVLDYVKRHAHMSHPAIAKETPKRDSTEFIIVSRNGERYRCILGPDYKIKFEKE
jgi:hypothetical protein